MRRNLNPAARHALAEDLPALEHALAVAFADDPMITWISALTDRARRIEMTTMGFFRPALACGIQRGHLYTADGCPGAAVWSPPDVRMFTEVEGMAFGAAIHDHLGPAAVPRLMALGAMVGSHHPSESHFYLFLLGAAEQGRGIGTTVIRPVLDRCDADGLPAYLESSSERNRSFYERHGFRVLWEDRPAGDGPLFCGMWRDPA